MGLKSDAYMLLFAVHEKEATRDYKQASKKKDEKEEIASLHKRQWENWCGQRKKKMRVERCGHKETKDRVQAREGVGAMVHAFLPMNCRFDPRPIRPFGISTDRKTDRSALLSASLFQSTLHIECFSSSPWLFLSRFLYPSPLSIAQRNMHAMHAIIVVIAVRLSALDLFVLYCVCIVCSAELSSFLHHLTPLRNFQCAFFFLSPLSWSQR